MNHVLGPLGVHERAARGDIYPLVVNHFNDVFCAMGQSDEESTRRGGDEGKRCSEEEARSSKGREQEKRSVQMSRLVYLLVACNY